MYRKLFQGSKPEVVFSDRQLRPANGGGASAAAGVGGAFYLTLGCGAQDRAPGEAGFSAAERLGRWGGPAALGAKA
jgi:hypothetical protein